MTRGSTMEAARHRWSAVLLGLGVSSKYLTGRQGPCPACGGKDRFRFDNKDGDGTWYCNSCGPGDGLGLLKLNFGWDFREAARAVDQFLGNNHNLRRDKDKQDLSYGQRKRILTELWQGSRPTQSGDIVDTYLGRRGVRPVDYFKAVRTHPNCRRLDGTYGPAMLAVVMGPDGRMTHLHRTYLDPDTGMKADLETPRALTAGALPDAAAVRLRPHRGVLGVAEGIETAMACMKRFKIPVWSVINSGGLERFVVPDNVSEFHVFGDNDKNFTGQKSAYVLGHKAVNAAERANRQLEVHVRMPPTVGTDWAD